MSAVLSSIMPTTLHEDSCDANLPSLGLTFDPSFNQTLRLPPYRSRRVMALFEEDDPQFDFASDDGHSINTVADYEPSLLFSVTSTTSCANVDEFEAMQPAQGVLVNGQGNNIVVSIFKKFAAVVKRVLGSIMKPDF